MKKTFFAFLMFIICIIICGCALLPFGSAAEKDFTKAGMTITLTESFAEKEHLSYTAVYDSVNVAVFALKEDSHL